MTEQKENRTSQHSQPGGHAGNGAIGGGWIGCLPYDRSDDGNRSGKTD